MSTPAPWHSDWTPSSSTPEGGTPRHAAGVTASTSVASAVEQAAATAAATAARAALPDLLAQIAARVQEEITSVLGHPPEPPSLDEFTRASARSRAIRTFFIGLGLSVVWGVVNVLGSLAGVNFFDKTAWTSTLSILVSSVVASVCSYVLRIKIVPGYAATPLARPGP